MTIEQAATRELLKAGVPEHFSGFRYLHSAIVICYTDVDKLGLVTKVLYPEIAKLYSVGDWRRIERCMRSALKKSNSKHRTSSAFLSAVTWYLKQLDEPPA